MKKQIVFITSIFAFCIIILLGTITGIDLPINLMGIVSENQKPMFTVKDLYDGSWQNEYEKFYRDAFPLRKFFVKVNNQISYLLHANINKNIIIGKSGWLYSTEYISTGLEPISSSNMQRYDDYVKKVKIMQDTIEKSGKRFIYIITPSKVEMYPEFLPWRLKIIADTRGNIINNYDYLLERLKAENINLLDAKSILEKEKGEIPFFSKTGIHWNYYAAAICAKELLNRLDYSSKISIETTPMETPYGTEQDIYQLSNIFGGLVDDEYYQVILTCPELNNRDKQRCIEMGTSFSGELAAAFGANRDLIWSRLTRYQYFAEKTIYSKDTIIDYQVGACNESLKDELINADIIILENNNSYVPESHFEFVDYVSELSVEDLKGYNELGDKDIVIDFSLNGNSKEYIEDGVYEAEESGSWAQPCMECSVYLEGSEDLEIDFSETRLAEGTTIKFNGVVVWASDEEKEKISAVKVPKELIHRDKKNLISISTEKKILSPKEQKISEDERFLAHWIEKIVISFLEEGR